MYGSCGALEAARALFTKINPRDQFSWNFIVKVYTLHGMCKEAIQLLDEMQREGCLPDRFVFASIISACSSQAYLAQGKRMHVSLKSSAFDSDVVVGNALVNMYGKCGSLKDSCDMFENMLEHDAISWTVMITSCVQNGRGKDALRLFAQMQMEGAMPDKILLTSMLDACASQAALADGKRKHVHVVACGFDSDSIVQTSLINMYGACGNDKEARVIFNRMHHRDVVSWSAIIASHANPLHVKNALRLLHQMQEEGLLPDKITFISILSACSSEATIAEGKQIHACIVGSGFQLDVPVGNALINMYSKCGSLNDALMMFKNMRGWDSITFLSILSACGNEAALTEGMCIHASILETAVELDAGVGNALVNMYGKCGSLHDAQRTFNTLPIHDIISWNGMIAACAQNGKVNDALQLLDQMQEGERMPNQVTFKTILSACSHGGLVDQGCSYFMSMTQHYCISPLVDHYNCMVDLLGRAGRLDEAEDLLINMPIEPTAVSWMTMLSACRVNGDVERGEHAAKHVFSLDAENISPYIVLLNLYATAGRWSDAMKVMNRMCG